jgi:hypothetical protein
VEGVFSSSKDVSISQKCKREAPKPTPLLFITKHSRGSRYALVGGNRRVHRLGNKRGRPRPSHRKLPHVLSARRSNDRVPNADVSIRRALSATLPREQLTSPPPDTDARRLSLQHYRVRRTKASMSPLYSLNRC